MYDGEILGLFPKNRVYRYRSDPTAENPYADVSAEATRFGFRLPVTLTEPVWRSVICWDETNYIRPVTQPRPSTRHHMRRVEALLAHADSALKAARNRRTAGYPPAPTRFDHDVHAGPAADRYMLGLFLGYWHNGKPILVIDMDPDGSRPL
ncbi:hypothetical protein [Nocardia alni]|uniref:hypothetical protein n=1 Tax=Nocardia alni TaxID=2815723 RepID=UPI001C214396|nr:hypothetical protein [Nocardia alni]